MEIRSRHSQVPGLWKRKRRYPFVRLRQNRYIVNFPDYLTELYFISVGRNSNLLLSVPPDKNGRFTEYDLNRLHEWRLRLDEIFAYDLFRGQSAESSSERYNSVDYAAENCLDNNRDTFWATGNNIKEAELVLTMSRKRKINIVHLEEAIEYGQRISSFSMFYDSGGVWEKFYQGTTVGRSRIVIFETIETDKIKIVINESRASPTLRIVKGFYSEHVKI